MKFFQKLMALFDTKFDAVEFADFNMKHLTKDFSESIEFDVQIHQVDVHSNTDLAQGSGSYVMTPVGDSNEYAGCQMLKIKTSVEGGGALSSLDINITGHFNKAGMLVADTSDTFSTTYQQFDEVPLVKKLDETYVYAFSKQVDNATGEILEGRCSKCLRIEEEMFVLLDIEEMFDGEANLVEVSHEAFYFNVDKRLVKIETLNQHKDHDHYIRMLLTPSIKK